MFRKSGILLRRMKRRLGRAARWCRMAGTELLLPGRCACCDAEAPPAPDGLQLCDDCRRTLAPEAWPGCPRCGAFLCDGPADATGCRLCRKTPLCFSTVIPLGGYYGKLREVVLRMKSPGEEPLSAAMSGLLARRRGPQLVALEADMVVPVPLFWWRRMGRGANSPETIAAQLGRLLGLPVGSRVLVRRRDTLPQKGLPPKRRFQNVRGAFAVRRRTRLDGRRILLVDDILTTGATSSEAARALCQAGAAMVAVAVIARAQGGDLR